jgi:di/tricarboxylate transporter
MPSRRSLAGIVIALGALMAMPWVPEGLTPADWRAVVVALAAIAFWALAILPEDLVGLTFFAVAMVLAVAPAEVTFAGFQSPAVWLVFGGLVLGVAVTTTGLDRVIAQRFRPLYRTSYGRCVAVTVALAIALAFLVPSTMTRVLLLIPIMKALAEDLGYAEGTSAHTGLMLAAIIGTHFPAVTILPATVPTVALVGAADSLFGAHLTYASFLLVHGPVLGLGKAVLLVLVVTRLFPGRPPGAVPPVEVADDPRRGRLRWLVVAALALWATDALHGIAAAWIALAVGVVCLLPRIGVLVPADLQTKVNLRPVFYVAAILSVGAVLDHTGIGGDVVATLAAGGWLQPGRDLVNTVVLAAAGLTTAALATMPGIAAILVPVAGDISQVTGLSLDTILRALVLGYSTAFLPYQVPPVLVGLGVAGIGIAVASRAMIILAGLSILFLWPLSLLWWALIG